jgi:hypothetical protein
MPLMTVREFGRHAGLSHVAVLKALRSGRIRRNAEGLIDSDQADRDLLAHTHPVGKVHQTLGRQEGALAASAGAGGKDDFGFKRARAVREHYEALLAKVEYEKRTGEVLDANEVKIASHRIGQIFRDRMLQVPGAVVARLQAHIREHRAAPDEHSVHLILTDVIRGSLTEYADELLAGAS